MKLLVKTARKLKELASNKDGSGLRINYIDEASKSITVNNFKEEYRIEFTDNDDIDNFIQRLHDLKNLK